MTPTERRPDPSLLRRRWRCARAVVALLAALLAAVPAAAQNAAEPRPLAAVVAASSGDTRLVRPSSLIAPVRPGHQVRSGDRVSTGDDGQIELRFLDDAVIVVRPGSEFRVEAWRYDAEGERAFFSLMRGALRAVSGAIGKREGRREDFRLNTPTATIGIRGTEFETVETRCGPAGCRPGELSGLTVTVIAGRVAVTNDAGTVEVPQGATLHVLDRTTASRFVSGGPPPPAPARVRNGAARPASAPVGTGGTGAPAGTGIAPETYDR